MKKLIVMLLAIFCAAALLAGCGDSASASGDVVEIGEKLFIQQCNDLYANPDDYEDKLVKIEGLCDVWEQDGETHYAVYRRTPGCCGDDGVMGFYLYYEGETEPQMGDWIAVTAKVKAGKDASGYTTVELVASEVTVTEERGAEFVTT